MSGPDISIVNWLLAASPVVFLVAAIVRLSWSVPRVGAVACVLALALALLVFGAEPGHAAIAAAKGISLSLFVLTIVWTSVYLFNVLDRLKAIDAIGRSMAALAGDGLAQALIIGWGFSSFIQGITGFGVPVAVTAPLLIMLGFSPARAAAMSLVGHGWAVTFGSMASSYYTIQLVTGIEGEVIAPHMALLFAPVIVASGALVAHIQGGAAALARSLPLVVVAGLIMAGAMYVLALVGAPQIASTVPGVLGMAAIALLARTPLLLPAPRAAAVSAPQGVTGAGAEAFSTPMPLLLALLPYLLLVTLSVISQIGPVMEAVRSLRLSVDYPGFTTGQGFVVAPASNYAPISLLNHPAPLILMSTLVSVAAYALAGPLAERHCPGGGEAHLQAEPQLYHKRYDDGGDGGGDGRHGHDGAAGKGHCGRVRAAVPAGVAVHRAAWVVHERQQHQLERYVRAAPDGDGEGAWHRRGDHIEHTVDRGVGGQLNGACEGAGWRGGGWTRRRGAEHLPYGDPVRDRAGPAYRPGGDDNRPPAAGACPGSEAWANPTPDAKRVRAEAGTLMLGRPATCECDRQQRGLHVWPERLRDSKAHGHCGQADAQLEDHVGEACKVGPVPQKPDGIDAERREGRESAQHPHYEKGLCLRREGMVSVPESHDETDDRGSPGRSRPGSHRGRPRRP